MIQDNFLFQPEESERLPAPESSDPLSSQLSTLDAHAHLHPSRPPIELAGTGVVLAMTLSLEEAGRAVTRKDVHIAWGVGCHPRFPKPQASFDIDRFRELVEKTAVVGEIGLDCGSRVPPDVQMRTFRQALEVLSGLPRLVSIHSYRATGLVLEELQRNPLAAPVLHWWTGTAQETRQAVALGCYFSIHSAVARQSKFRIHIPKERILVESDHGYNDPPAAIPFRIGWVEHLVAQQYKLGVAELRWLTWHNLASIVSRTGTINMLPEGIASAVTRLEQQASLYASTA